ncbi:MAG: 3-dehydroquinate synthase [Lachnospiraceae bacterium]|nr:3-dehydroquinate synthase [Lachnospiraceae bacterium]
MSQRLTINLNNQPIYDIVYEQNFKNLAKELEPLGINARKLCVITDTRVKGLYADEVCGALKDYCREIVVYDFPNGEESKNLDTVRNIYTFLIQNKFGRKDMLLALGGGVVGDTTGFVAATYLRGIDFVQVPTTLLAQVDSSIGGKTGVDFDQYKNMVGAFYMPKLVYMNVSTLKTLDDRQYYSGMGEVLKHGLIKSAKFYEWIIDNMYEIHERNLETLEDMVYKSCTCKKLVVEKDPTEKGERAILNFGHTIGHAIEKAKNFELMHGECVALGCVAAAYISWKRELLSKDEYYEIRDMFVPFNLPISIENIDPEEIYALTTSDKKMDGNQIKFILLKKVGKAIIDTTVTKEEIIAGINEIYFTDEDWDE